MRLNRLPLLEISVLTDAKVLSKGLMYLRIFKLLGVNRERFGRAMEHS